MFLCGNNKGTHSLVLQTEKICTLCSEPTCRLDLVLVLNVSTRASHVVRVLLNIGTQNLDQSREVHHGHPTSLSPFSLGDNEVLGRKF